MPLEFDAEKHSYTLDGKTLPSVTTIIKHCLPKTEYEISDPFYRDRGTAVHESVRLSILDDLGECDEWLKPYLDAFNAFKAKHSFKSFRTEVVLASEHHRFAGTVDAIAEVDGMLCVVDWKTGALQRWHALQTAAYAILADANSSAFAVPLGRCAVQLSGDGTFKVRRYEGPKYDGDRETFLAMVRVHRWNHAFKKQVKEDDDEMP